MKRFLALIFAAALWVGYAQTAMSATLETEDGIYMRFRDSSGELLALANRSEPVPLHVSDMSYPTFSVTDAASDTRSDTIAVSNINKNQGDPIFLGKSGKAAIQLTTAVTADFNRIQYRMDVEDLSGEDRALTIRYQLPIDAEGWLWWDNPHTSRGIETGKCYTHYDNDTRGNYPICWTPLGVISQKDGPHALTFSVALAPSALARIGYDGDFYIEFDLGLSPETKTPGKANLEFQLYNSSPDWGFRAALEKYYFFYPTLFTKRVNREGGWVARIPTQAIRNIEDYLITFHEVSTVKTNAVEYDNRAGMYALRYAMPHWNGLDMPGGKKKPTSQEVEEYLNNAAADSSHPDHDRAKFLLATSTRNVNGGFRVHNRPPRLGNPPRVIIETNLDPDLPSGADRPNSFGQWEQNQLPSLLSLREGRHDGQYIDSAEFLVDGMDMNREHFKYADYPLQWHSKFKKPGVSVAVAKFEYLEKEAAILRSHGQLMMSNFTPWRFGFYMTAFDINGTEVWEYNWPVLYQRAMEREGGKEVLKDVGVSDEQMDDFRIQAENMGGEESQDMKVTDWRREDLMYYRRMTSYQKPYLFLMKLYTEAQMAVFGVERYRELMDWCLFFGVYPSCSEGLFQAPEEFRELYKLYMPVCRAIGTAGWEPVTHARTSAPDIRVERYGYSLQQTLHFTVRNFGEEAKTAQLAINRENLILSEKSRVVDAFTGEELPMRATDDALNVELSLQPRQTRVVRVIAVSPEPKVQRKGTDGS